MIVFYLMNSTYTFSDYDARPWPVAAAGRHGLHARPPPSRVTASPPEFRNAHGPSMSPPAGTLGPGAGHDQVDPAAILEGCRHPLRQCHAQPAQRDDTARIVAGPAWSVPAPGLGAAAVLPCRDCAARSPDQPVAMPLDHGDRPVGMPDRGHAEACGRPDRSGGRLSSTSPIAAMQGSSPSQRQRCRQSASQSPPEPSRARAALGHWRRARGAGQVAKRVPPQHAFTPHAITWKAGPSSPVASAAGPTSRPA